MIRSRTYFVTPSLRLPAKADAQDKLPYGQAGGHHRQHKFQQRVMDSRLRGNDEVPGRINQ